MDGKTITYLERIGACNEAIEWVETQDTLERAWANCKRGDWLVWYIFATGAAGEPWSEKRKLFVLAICKCARLGLRYVPEGEDRPRKCILTAERWARGKATKEEVKRAAWVARAAVVTGSVWVARAAVVAGSAWAEAGALWAAAGAVWAAVWAGSAENRVHAKCADIIRRYYPQLPKANRREN